MLIPSCLWGKIHHRNLPKTCWKVRDSLQPLGERKASQRSYWLFHIMYNYYLNYWHGIIAWGFEIAYPLVRKVFVFKTSASEPTYRYRRIVASEDQDSEHLIEESKETRVLSTKTREVKFCEKNKKTKTQWIYKWIVRFPWRSLTMIMHLGSIRCTNIVSNKGIGIISRQKTRRS